MKYLDFMKKQTECPFCGKNNIYNRILLENEGAILTFARAPYQKHHLLVVPKKHVESAIELPWDDYVCMLALLQTGQKLVSKLGHDNWGIIARDGKSPGKSVDHLHYHIIPNAVIEDISMNEDERKMLTDDEEKALKKVLKKYL